MTLQVDLYYTMRSPYCYLATPTLTALVERYDMAVRLKPVYPLAVSQPGFFAGVNPLWIPYVQRDTRRIAERLGIPFHFPRPDPIVQDLQTRRIAAEQPHIPRLTRLAVLAAERDQGLPFVASVSATLYSPDVKGWDQGDHLAEAVAKVGLDLAEMDGVCAAEHERLDAVAARNREDQLAAGHWGAPLFVYNDEPFFGQDRIDDLLWRMQKDGLRERA